MHFFLYIFLCRRSCCRNFIDATKVFFVTQRSVTIYPNLTPTARPANRGATGQFTPPKFTKTRVVVTYSNRLQLFPPKISGSFGLAHCPCIVRSKKIKAPCVIYRLLICVPPLITLCRIEQKSSWCSGNRFISSQTAIFRNKRTRRIGHTRQATTSQVKVSAHYPVQVVCYEGLCLSRQHLAVVVLV